jgi:hypothetical protein
LKATENTNEGLRAKAPDAEVSVADHIAQGSDNPSQFISTSATYAAAKKFAKKGWNQPKTIVKIDVKKLKEENPEIVIINLTDRGVLNDHVDKKEFKTRGCAINYHEILLIGYVPSSCISIMD